MHTTFRPILDTLKMIPPIGIEDTPFQIFWVRILKKYARNKPKTQVRTVRDMIKESLFFPIISIAKLLVTAHSPQMPF